MGYIVTTDIFCDECLNRVGNPVSEDKVNRISVYRAAKLFGWAIVDGCKSVQYNIHICPECLGGDKLTKLVENGIHNQFNYSKELLMNPNQDGIKIPQLKMGESFLLKYINSDRPKEPAEVGIGNKIFKMELFNEDFMKVTRIK